MSNSPVHDSDKPRFPYRGHCGGRHPATPWAMEAEGLHVAYPESERAAIHGITFRVKQGTRHALVGPNGAGKSTLLLAAAGLLPAGKGTLRLFGHAPGACQHQVAYLSQRTEIDWRFPVTVEKLVLAGRYVHLGWGRRATRDDRQKAAAALDLLRLGDLAQRQIGRLSGGQQQRALLARALVHDADLYLLDEPLNAVDAETRQIVAEVLDTLRDDGRTVLMATHDLGRLESDFDGALYLADGHIVDAPPGSFGEH